MAEEKDKKEKSEKELAEEYLAGWQRAKADLANYKKDEAKRLEEVAKFSNEVLIKELLTVLDSFDLGIAALEKESKAEKGIYLIKTQLEDVLKKFGLARLVVPVGQEFDPTLHEAVAVVNSDKPSGTIVDEVERGYTLHGKLIRPARVKISK